MPSDLARFRTLTMGRPLIMGRRTWDSIGRPLPGRTSIVLSRKRRDLPLGVLAASDTDDALAIASDVATRSGADAIALIGGATLFAELMPRTQRLHLTIVDLSPDADTFFPAIDLAAWRETLRHVPPPRVDDEARCTFIDLERV